MVAIALIAGFCLGAGCTAALLVGLKALLGFIGEKAGVSGTAARSENAEIAGPDNEGKIPIDQQWQNLWDYKGTDQKNNGVEKNGD